MDYQQYLQAHSVMRIAQHLSHCKHIPSKTGHRIKLKLIFKLHIGTFKKSISNFPILNEFTSTSEINFTLYEGATLCMLHSNLYSSRDVIDSKFT